jgi:sec-independent protein translocase protein TatC
VATSSSGAEMPFLDHLEELRFRLMWAVGALILGVGAAFALVIRFNLAYQLQRPILPYLDGRSLIITHPADGFRVHMLIAFALGFVIALPVILYHLWAFLAPALYQHEKRVVLPVIFVAAALFFGGVCLSWFVILPFTLRFLLTFQAGSFEEMIRAAEYFGFATSISLALGGVFEVPILILLLTALGIVTPKMLHAYRRHAMVGCIIVAAFITPGGDPMTLAVFSVPLYLLYEVSVVVSEVVHRRRLRREARREREADAEREGAIA